MPAYDRRSYKLRPAREAEAGLIAYLRLASLLCLEMRHQPLRAIHALMELLPDVDSPLLASGRYLVAEGGGELIGGAGWSLVPLSFRIDRLFDEVGDRASLSLRGNAVLVRGFFLDPDTGRRGAASGLISRIEADAGRAGYSAAELVTPAASQAHYRNLGFKPVRKLALRLDKGEVLPLLQMRRGFACRLAVAA